MEKFSKCNIFKSVQSQQTSFYKILLTLNRFIIIVMDKDSQYFQLQPYKKNVSFKYEELKLQNENKDKEKDKDKNKDKDKDEIFFNLWDNNFELAKKIQITDDLKIRYENEEKLFKLKIDNINGTIQTGQIEEVLYFKPTSLIQTGLIYDMFSVLEDKLCDKLNISFLDIIDRLGMFRINCRQDIPLNKVVYLRDLIVVFDCVNKVNYRGKIKYCIVCNIVKGDILLQK